MLVKIFVQFLAFVGNYINLKIFQSKEAHFIVTIDYSIFIQKTQKKAKIEKFKKLKFY